MRSGHQCNLLFLLVPPSRFERETFPLGGGRSILLSYGGVGERF